MSGPLLNSSRTFLTPIGEKDFEILYNWITDSENIMLWSTVRQFPTKENYFQYLKYKLENSFFSHFIIRDKNSNPVGTVIVYDENLIDRVAYFSIYIDPRYRNKYFGVEVCYILFDYLFSYYSIRKLYIETYSYNFVTNKIIKRIGFSEEGCLKNHRYYQGCYCDLFIHAFYIENWLNIKPKFKKLFTP